MVAEFLVGGGSFKVVESFRLKESRSKGSELRFTLFDTLLDTLCSSFRDTLFEAFLKPLFAGFINLNVASANEVLIS